MQKVASSKIVAILYIGTWRSKGTVSTLEHQAKDALFMEHDLLFFLSAYKNAIDRKKTRNLHVTEAFSISPSWERKQGRDIRELKQTDAVAVANLQISIQKDSRPSEFSRPLTSITLNLNGKLPVGRCRVSLLKLPIGWSPPFPTQNTH